MVGEEMAVKDFTAVLKVQVQEMVRLLLIRTEKSEEVGW
jgi:hypothetical protein